MTAKHKINKIDIETFKEKINNHLRRERSPEARKALASLCEEVLSETGNYQGFNYVDFVREGVKKWKEAGKPKDKSRFIGDETNIFFFSRTTLI